MLHPAARLLKAVSLTDYLQAAGISSSRAALMDESEWSMLATAAAVRIPSGETRNLVLSMLRAREEARKNLARLRRRRISAVNACPPPAV
jgi:hypothetical protein